MIKTVTENGKIMKEKTRHILCQIINSVILAGIIILLIGLYYWVVKAGIPYQEPTLEMQIEYAVNMGIGDKLVVSGVKTLSLEYIIQCKTAILSLLLGFLMLKYTFYFRAFPHSICPIVGGG